MQTTSSKTEVLHDVEYFHWFAFTAVLCLFVDDQIYVHISVDEVSICAPLHRSLDSHQTMLLSSLQDSRGIQSSLLQGILDVGFNPTNVFTSPESPSLQTLSSSF